MNTVDLIIQAYTHVATQPGTKKIETEGHGLSVWHHHSD
jgi:hypothetical protein